MESWLNTESKQKQCTRVADGSNDLGRHQISVISAMCHTCAKEYFHKTIVSSYHYFGTASFGKVTGGREFTVKGTSNVHVSWLRWHRLVCSDATLLRLKSSSNPVQTRPAFAYGAGYWEGCGCVRVSESHAPQGSTMNTLGGGAVVPACVDVCGSLDQRHAPRCKSAGYGHGLPPEYRVVQRQSYEEHPKCRFPKAMGHFIGTILAEKERARPLQKPLCSSPEAS